MATELRLHRPHESDGPQREIRYRLWWNLFILEKMISCEMGRPVMLRVEETDTPYPSTSEADEFELPPARMKRQNSTNVHCAGKMRTLSVLVMSIQLAVVMERLSREVYGLMSRRAIRDDRSFGEAKRLEIWSAFQEWERSIEASPLRLDLSNNLTSVSGVVTNYVSKQPGGGDNAESQRRLKMCIHWLSVLGKSWKSAGARQQLLVDLSAMPQDVNMTTLANAAAAIDAQESTTSQLLSEQESIYARHSTADATSGVTKPVAPTEDWEFLRGFGDSSDEFYVLDEELRVLLESDQQWNL
ncbi:hypothetical protein SS1G_12313 [Sclerotinia sclerotiorum 1980 UF-70]|uniref:Xylanolytic transcriptional activator regulatory domain-containing protein n=1 Tax=Sclerotinia sclerotiorum (strain ATCC 18683 / 1980 / Ss-1) TaxID=665079 RepID=A7F315_SCLS1|nr:hypothetical protein SS1G_12313 [Sclerotinia sclerotiorum 1980 UF-70]EDN96107.1 hypothetical protein SS1G_12313 [Sclerotinia sclerotiorum 1980 UF-70]